MPLVTAVPPHLCTDGTKNTTSRPCSKQVSTHNFQKQELLCTMVASKTNPMVLQEKDYNAVGVNDEWPSLPRAAQTKFRGVNPQGAAILRRNRFTNDNGKTSQLSGPNSLNANIKSNSSVHVVAKESKQNATNCGNSNAQKENATFDIADLVPIKQLTKTCSPIKLSNTRKVWIATMDRNVRNASFAT
jgi:hypothetical protein